MRKFIWHPDPQEQSTNCTWFVAKKASPFAVYRFQKEHRFAKKAVGMEISFFADTKYVLTVNGQFLGMGPVCPGGDYLNCRPMPVQYYNCYALEEVGTELKFDVLVQLGPVMQTEISCGRGGLWAEYTVRFEDGTAENFTADESWFCRRETAYLGSKEVDLLQSETPWVAAKFCENIWNLKPSPIENLVEERIEPLSVTETAEGILVEFDKIYAAYPVFELESAVPFTLEATIHELPGKREYVFSLKGQGAVKHRTLRMYSVGGMVLKGIAAKELKGVHLLYSHYPTHQKGYFACSDPELTKIWQVGVHTEEICRQSLHLDSPGHQENLSDPGDYLIEGLIDVFNFGDTTLSRFDLVRIATYFEMNEGRLFHTSYTLLWVSMLWDNYLYSGDRTVLEECRPALDILLKTFEGYLKDGLVENPPDYMFIDWVPVEGYNMHHPPKALGQSALNAFYYGALLAAAKIYEVLGLPNDCAEKAIRLKEAFQCFYDEERGLYCGGSTDFDPATEWKPENPQKKYYTVHANILAALYDLHPDGKGLLERTFADPTLIDMQAYFAHFALEAAYRHGLFGTLGMKILERWKPVIAECEKGFKEVWGNTPGNWDYSHAWGATAAYQLPAKILGIKMLEPGWKKIALKPDLFGLEWAEIRIPTPYGDIHYKNGECIVPEEIEQA